MVFLSFFLLFGLKFLNLRNTLRVWHKIILWYLVVIWFLYLFDIALVHFSGNVLLGIRLIFPISIVISLIIQITPTIIRIRRGFKPGWYFLLANINMIFVISYLLSQFRRLPIFLPNFSEDTFITLSIAPIYIGALIQILLFAFGLGYKMRASEKEKKLAQEKVIEQLKENEQLKEKVNRELEQKVLERTSEIREKKEEIEAQRDEIEAQRDEIESQRDEIEAQRDIVIKQKNQIERTYHEISESIDYATRLQGSILPNTNLLVESFADSFIYFKPKQKVSGDFYWWTKYKDQIVIAVVDCTGHGVPGAFMSTMGISLLREIISKDHVTQPDIILHRMREEVIRSLDQRGDQEEQKDGMDLALVNINTDTLQCKYAGANNPIYLIRDQELSEYKPDRMPISFYSQMDHFNSHEIQLQTGDLIYLFSDGFVDQFGGKDRKKFKAVNFKQLLLSVHKESMEKQKKIIEDTFETWRADFEQIDDVCVVGIRI
jgi:serine phosphatase RsbU (regulator of sigma subunit)